MKLKVWDIPLVEIIQKRNMEKAKVVAEKNRKNNQVLIVELDTKIKGLVGQRKEWDALNT